MNVRRPFARLLVVLVTLGALGAAFLGAATEAGAQATPGSPSVAVTRFGVRPNSPGWRLEVTLADTTTGRPAPGWNVSAVGVDPTSGAASSPIAFHASSTPGVYAAVVRTRPGHWTLNVSAAPGGSAGAAAAIGATFSAYFPSAAGPTSSNGAKTVLVVLLVVLLAVVVLCLYTFVHRRRLVAAANHPAHVALVDEENAIGIAPAFAAILDEKLVEAGWKRRALASLGSKVVCLDVVDLGTKAFLELGPTALDVYSERGPEPDITISLPSDWVTKVVELPQGAWRLPGLWKHGGTEITKAILNRTIRVTGLVTHPVLSIRMLQVLSVPPASSGAVLAPADAVPDMAFEAEDALWA